jgi:hypothetical protein
MLAKNLGNHDIDPMPARLTANDINTRPHWYSGATVPGYYLITLIDDADDHSARVQYDLMIICPFCGTEIER